MFQSYDASASTELAQREPASTRPRNGWVRRLPAIVAAVAIYGFLAITLVFVTPGLFGFHTYVGVGSSMGETIPSGSLIVTRTVATEDVEVGDVISFRWPNFENPITHRVIDIGSRGGETVFVTQGDGNRRQDPFLASGDQEIGRVIQSVPHLGTYLPAAKALTYVLAFFGGYLLFRRHRARRLAAERAAERASLEGVAPPSDPS